MRMSTTQVLCPNREAVGFFVMTGFHILITLSLLPVTRSLRDRSRWKHLTPCQKVRILLTNNIFMFSFIYKLYFHAATRHLLSKINSLAGYRIDNTKDISIAAIINNIVQKIQYIVRFSIRYWLSSDQIFKIKI